MGKLPAAAYIGEIIYQTLRNTAKPMYFQYGAVLAECDHISRDRYCTRWIPKGGSVRVIVKKACVSTFCVLGRRDNQNTVVITVASYSLVFDHLGSGFDHHSSGDHAQVRLWPDAGSPEDRKSVLEK